MAMVLGNFSIQFTFTFRDAHHWTEPAIGVMVKLTTPGPLLVTAGHNNDCKAQVAQVGPSERNMTSRRNWIYMVAVHKPEPLLGDKDES